MKIAWSKCVGVLLFAVMAGRARPVSAQDAPQQKPVLIQSIRSTINGATLVHRQFRAPPPPAPQSPEAELDGIPDSQDGGEPPKDSEVVVGENAFDQIIFGKGWTAELAEKFSQEDLRQEIHRCARRFGLTELHEQKVLLAGRGDIARFFEDIDRHKARFERLADGIRSGEAFSEWIQQLRAESKRLQDRWESPFAAGSLFAKTLASVVAPERRADLENWRENQPRLVHRAPGGLNTVQANRDARLDDPKVLADILNAWEAASAKIDRVDCKFVRFTYDPTFEIERRNTGSLAVDQKGRAAYRVEAAEIARGEQSKKKGKDGERYALQTANPERWHWTGETIVRVDEKDRTFDVVPLPAALQVAREFRPDPPELPREFEDRRDEKPVGHPGVWGLNIEQLKELWLARPFLLGMSAEQLQNQHKITLLKRTDAEVWLQFVPLRRADAHNLERAVLILNAERYTPMALQMIDPTGAENVHVFKDVQLNRIRRGQVNPAGLEDLEHPHLQGYRRFP